jgi:hypothetical protein
MHRASNTILGKLIFTMKRTLKNDVLIIHRVFVNNVDCVNDMFV